MTPKHDPELTSAERSLVLASLEHDQLAKARKTAIPRRRLKGGELLLLWTLRLYLVFMMAVVLYQIWTAVRPNVP